MGRFPVIVNGKLEKNWPAKNKRKKVNKRQGNGQRGWVLWIPHSIG
jgi:hypothetical protein